MKRILLYCLLLVAFVSCKTTQSPQKQHSESKHEMRALWVSTILNLDFPSSNKLTSEQQKKEFTNLLDTMAKYHFNTVVVQVRPSGDALYPSPYEPWSAVLTGTQGQAPYPYYDPLAFMIDEAHKRNIDFHAWLNPYRAVFNYKKAQIAANHPKNQHPEWFVNYGKHTYYNPALPEVRHFIAQIVGDITRRYDIDAIHMDDYFYPYRIANKEFPDAVNFRQDPRGFVDKAAWRRDNVNLIIKELHDTIKTAKPWVQFGISPFGVWRNADKDPRGSNTRAGQTNYDDLYADILLWDRNRWIDYVTPQIYWHIGHPAADYSTLVQWWSDNIQNAHLYIGQALYKIGHGGNYSEWNEGNEIVRQMHLNKQFSKIKGSIFFRSKFFEKEDLAGLKNSLQNTFYKKAILPPAIQLQTENPAPTAKLEKIKRNSYKLSWECPEGKGADALKHYLVYMFEGKNKVGNLENTKHLIRTTKEHEVIFNIDPKKKARKRSFVIVRVNKAKQKSEISNIVYRKF